jgi:hypothetical protein
MSTDAECRWQSCSSLVAQLGAKSERTVVGRSYVVCPRQVEDNWQPTTRLGGRSPSKSRAVGWSQISLVERCSRTSFWRDGEI